MIYVTNTIHIIGDFKNHWTDEWKLWYIYILLSNSNSSHTYILGTIIDRYLQTWHKLVDSEDAPRMSGWCPCSLKCIYMLLVTVTIPRLHQALFVSITNKLLLVPSVKTVTTCRALAEPWQTEPACRSMDKRLVVDKVTQTTISILIWLVQSDLSHPGCIFTITMEVDTHIAWTFRNSLPQFWKHLKYFQNLLHIWRNNCMCSFM